MHFTTVLCCTLQAQYPPIFPSGPEGPEGPELEGSRLAQRNSTIVCLKNPLGERGFLIRTQRAGHRTGTGTKPTAAKQEPDPTSSQAPCPSCPGSCPIRIEQHEGPRVTGIGVDGRGSLEFHLYSCFRCSPECKIQLKSSPIIWMCRCIKKAPGN